MTMRLTELQKKILTAIKSKLSHKDLCNLCTFNEISSAGLKRNIQERLESFVHSQTYNQLLLINNKIDEFITGPKKVGLPIAQVVPEVPKYDNSVSSYKADTLSDALLSQAPIKLDEEVALIDRNSIVVVLFTTYPNAQTPVPTQAVSGINERAHSVRLPNMLPHVPVQISPFYCCAICLHPLSMLVPNMMPNIPQNNRNTSHSSITFFLTDDVCKLIARNCQTTSAGKKVDFKWQVLLRFVAIDPTSPLPTPGQSVTQLMPPYLCVSVNNETAPLWEILPSNSRLKEGKRHPKPVNITERLNILNRQKNGFRQNIVIDWWQTPSVFQFYYVGVYLERKLSVKEILDLFVTNRHVNILPVEATLALIRSKLKLRSNDDDDMVVSSVLPISLSCPVGRSRIEIPIRTLNCQHLQCFDANLFLCMNERRSVWKCPVCETSATPNELFCDKYFQEILHQFKDNDEVNDINVNFDGTYIPVLKSKDEKVDTTKQKDTATTDKDSSMIILDSDDEGDSHPKVRTPQKSVPQPKNGHVVNKVATINSFADQSQKTTTPKLNYSIDILNQTLNSASILKVSDQNSTSDTNKEKRRDYNHLFHQSNLPLSKSMTATIVNSNTTVSSTTALPKSAITYGPSNIRITAPLSSSNNNNPTTRPTVTIASNSFATPPPSYTPASSIPNLFCTSSNTPPPSSFSLTSSSAAAPGQTNHQAKFQMTSLLQSPSSHGTTYSPIAAPVQSPLPAPIQAPIHATLPTSLQTPVNAIPAPIQPSSIFAAIQSSTTTNMPNLIKTLDNSKIIHSPSNKAINSTIFESLIKLNPSSTPPSFLETFNKSLSSAPSSSASDPTRTRNDVVKAPPANVASTPEPAAINKDFITKPISCPKIVINSQPEQSTEQTKEPIITKPPEPRRTTLNDVLENIGLLYSTSAHSVTKTESVSQSPASVVAKSEFARRTKPVAAVTPASPPVAAPATAAVATPAPNVISIPSVSIDLTEEDDEEDEPIMSHVAPPSRPIIAPNTRWMNMKEFKSNKFAMPDRSRGMVVGGGGGRPGINNNNNSFSHYKTHRFETGKRHSPCNTAPIDLTNDEEEEAGERDLALPAHKRQRMAAIEDGQINDTDSDSGSSSSSSSSSVSPRYSSRIHGGVPHTIFRS